MTRHVAVLLLIVAAFTTASCSTPQVSERPLSTPTTSTPSVIETGATSAKPDPHSDLHLGQAAVYDDGFEVALVEAKRGPKDYEGNDTALFKVRYVNKTSGQLRANFDDWYIEAADGTRYDTGGTSVGFSDETPRTLGFEDIAPGRSYMGLEAIRLPRAAKPVRVGFAESTQAYRVSDWKVSF